MQESKNQEMASKLGRICYLADINEAPKVGTIKMDEDKRSIVIEYDGVKYATPTKWIMGAFFGSGKFIRYPDIPKIPDTPRKSSFYQPPPKRSFGDFV